MNDDFTTAGGNLIAAISFDPREQMESEDMKYPDTYADHNLLKPKRESQNSLESHSKNLKQTVVPIRLCISVARLDRDISTIKLTKI
jgi:hypothetical protein